MNIGKWLEVQNSLLGGSEKMKQNLLALTVLTGDTDINERTTLIQVKSQLG